ncbi:MAG TPA: PIN domain-containing protein [Chlamydiales bacterium]|nr:PIN domain-containing protein [Chlamydiales bacterium]
MFSGFIVLFDACVLYQAPVRDLVIELAIAELYRAKWTNKIHDEWIGSLTCNRPDISKEKLEHTRQLINESIEDCLIEGYENIAKTLTLPDSDDCHVLAAAIKAHAQMIVTYNMRDFPRDYLDSFGIEVQHPDTFFLNQSDLQQSVFLAAVKRIRLSLKRPAKTAEEYLDILRKSELAKTAEFLEDYVSLI